MARHLKAHTVKNFLCFYTSHIKKENFNKRKEYLHKNKQVPNKNAPYAMAACTTNNIVNALENAIEKDKETFKFEYQNDDLKVGFYSDSATFNGMGRNIDAFCFISVSHTQKLRLHPFNIFQDSDSKENCYITLSDQLILLQNLTGMTLVVS